jgi:ribosomal-protein-serine acetyltransferase
MSRFHIRPYLLADIPEIFDAVEESREHVARWMSWLTPEYDLEVTGVWVRGCINNWGESDYNHLIIETGTGNIAGSCGLNHLNKIDLVCNLGYWVRSSFLRQGAAREATLLIRDFAFQELDFQRLEIVVADGNDASRKVAESCNALYEGLQRSRLQVGGKPTNAHMYALIKPI